jgi:hypothetical protein
LPASSISHNAVKERERGDQYSFIIGSVLSSGSGRVLQNMPAMLRIPQNECGEWQNAANLLAE